jgi:thymidine phosphorylase
MIAAHGGDVKAFEAMTAGESLTIVSPSSGFVQEIDAVRLGHAARRLSARDSLGGLEIAVRIGDRVEQGEPLLHAFGEERELARVLHDAVTVSDLRTQPPPLIHRVLRNRL